MTDPNIQRLTSKIAQLQQEYQFERGARQDLSKYNYELSKEKKKLKEAFELFVNKTSSYLIYQGVNPCEWASYRDAVITLEEIK